MQLSAARGIYLGVAVSSDNDVPRLPRRLGFRPTGPQLVRIVLTAAILAMVVMTQRPCADQVAGFVTSFDDPGPPRPVSPPPGAVDGTVVPRHYEHLHPDMTEDEVKAAIEREKARAEAERPTPR